MKSLLIAHRGPAPSSTQLTPPVVGQMSQKVSAFSQANKSGKIIIFINPLITRREFLVNWRCNIASDKQCKPPLRRPAGKLPGSVAHHVWRGHHCGHDHGHGEQMQQPGARLLGSRMISEHFHYLRCDRLEGKWRRFLSQFYVLIIYKVMTINNNFIKLLSAEIVVRWWCCFVGFKFI